MARSEASIKFEQLVLSNIEKHGWHCTSVAGDGETPSFAYSVGLFKTYGHPELIIFGLPSKLSHAVLSTCARAAAAGQPLNIEQPTDELLENYSCVFIKVPEAAYSEYVLSTTRLYQGTNFPLYQVVWPSVGAGVFPWHPDAEASFVAEQPVLGRG